MATASMLLMLSKSEPGHLTAKLAAATVLNA